LFFNRILSMPRCGIQSEKMNGRPEKFSRILSRMAKALVGAGGVGGARVVGLGGSRKLYGG
jgi:hypothetical protein